jgi:cell fate regulator YaaT (PSP1 superfamily)
MPKVVGVRFSPVTKIYFFDPAPFSDLKVEDRVVVETARGLELGTVVLPIHDVPASEIKGKLKRVVRRATPLDLLQAEKYKMQEPEAMDTCAELVSQMNIPLKVIQASYNFDGSRLLFSFTAEQRVDFRDLVKELARSLRTRIEMKQVGARDETKILDGYGRCGRRLCCSSWLTEFHPVSIRMAKQQGLPLAPSEISGLCGRLLCCLAYEDQFYTEMRKKMPRVGSEIETDQGTRGIIRGLNIIKETVLLEVAENEAYLEVGLDELTTVTPAGKSSKATPRK